MLIDPDQYITEIKDKSLNGLIKERDKIIKQMNFYERNKGNKDAFDIHPAPEAVYRWDNIILIKLTNMIMALS